MKYLALAAVTAIVLVLSVVVLLGRFCGWLAGARCRWRAVVPVRVLDWCTPVPLRCRSDDDELRAYLEAAWQLPASGPAREVRRPR